MLYTICSPSGPYYATGFKPIKLVADENHVRAWPGGHGAYKLGANYGPTILPAHEWEKKGYSQILGVGPNGIIMEGGAMNIFFFWINEQGERELITCPLNGLILPGITRKSIIELTRSWNEFKVSEREFTIHDVMKAAQEHRLLECFTSGTAAVCGSINGILYNGKTIDIPLGSPEACTKERRSIFRSIRTMPRSPLVRSPSAYMMSLLEFSWVLVPTRSLKILGVLLLNKFGYIHVVLGCLFDNGLVV